jgi:alpha-ketoglutarate-dependent 2,4-dichlorophenoxyacetate dioxygenase
VGQKMTISINRLTNHFAAEVMGVDLCRDIGDLDFQKINNAFNEHSILVFRNQPLTDEQQVTFSERFGILEKTIKTKQQVGAGEIVTVLSNVGKNGDVISPEDRRMVFNTGNQMWHTDSSFKKIPAMMSLLSGREVPPKGGETEFASMRAAYDVLTEEKKQEIRKLICIHDFAYSRSLIDTSLLTKEDKHELPPVRQAMIRKNPVNQRDSLFLGAHASYIENFPLDKGRLLIKELNQHITKRDFIYKHKWKRDDLVIWDNRCALHRGNPWGKHYKRVMHRTTVVGSMTV